jgi:protein-tyrosine-phosphatase
LKALVNLLFICVENANRSQIAEAFGHMYATENMRIFSGGSAPAGKINPRAIAFMEEIGYNLRNHTSKSVEEFHTIPFDYVISMGCGDKCPYVPSKQFEDWQIPDPKELSDEAYRTIRDYIGIKVKDLINRASEPK